MGEHELNNDNDGATPLDIEIESKVIHENYNPKNLSNDIAVLTLKEDVEIFDEKISPVCLEHPELGSGDDGSPEKMVEVLDRDLPRTRFDFKTTTLLTLGFHELYKFNTFSTLYHLQHVGTTMNILKMCTILSSHGVFQFFPYISTHFSASTF